MHRINVIDFKANLRRDIDGNEVYIIEMDDFSRNITEFTISQLVRDISEDFTDVN